MSFVLTLQIVPDLSKTIPFKPSKSIDLFVDNFQKILIQMRLYYDYLCYLLGLDYLSLQQLRYYFPNCVYPNPPCELALWEETGAPARKKPTTFGRALTDSLSIARTCNATVELSDVDYCEEPTSASSNACLCPNT
jgi:hypothetical protein